MNPEEEAFLAAIRATPDDHRTRLVYADWLDENGQPEKAEYLRLRHEQLVIKGRLAQLHANLDSGWQLRSLGQCNILIHNHLGAGSKIQLIKLVREITGMGLAEVVSLVESPHPIRISKDLVPEVALEFKDRLSQHATVTVEPLLAMTE